MKKQKWFIRGIIPLLYSLARFGLTFLFMEIAWRIKNIDILLTFETIAFAAGPVILIVSCAAMVSAFKKYLDTCKSPENGLEPYFSAFSVLMIIKSIFDLFTAKKWLFDTFYLSMEIDKANGIPCAGHPSGMVMDAAIILVIIQVIAGFCIAGSMRRRYRAAAEVK